MDEMDETPMAESIADAVLSQMPATEVQIVDERPVTEFEIALPFFKVRLTWKG